MINLCTPTPYFNNFFCLLTEKSGGLLTLIYPTYLLWCEIMCYHPPMCCQVTTKSLVIANKAFEIKCLFKYSKHGSKAYLHHGTDLKWVPNNSRWSLYPYQSQRKDAFYLQSIIQNRIIISIPGYYTSQKNVHTGK